jgi:hypothetical protein
MSGQSLRPEPLPAGSELPAQPHEAAHRPEPSQLIAGPPGAAPAGGGKAYAPRHAVDATPAGAGESKTPAGVGTKVSAGPPGTVPDPAAVTGPSWPRLVAPAGAYTPPRLIRWPIVVGIVLLAGWVAATVAVRAAPTPARTSTSSPVAVSSTRSVAGYVVTAHDAHFGATFPSKPRRARQTVGTATVVVYIAQVSGHGVGVTYLPLPASASFSLYRGVSGVASSLPGGKVVSRRTLTYLGQPAEDAVISSSAGFAQIRIVRFRSSAYVLEGFGRTPASFAHGYKVLLDTFAPHP